MAKKDGRRYTDKFKFQVILEALRSQKPDAEVARASEQKISKLERMVGQKEVELALRYIQWDEDADTFAFKSPENLRLLLIAYPSLVGGIHLKQLSDFPGPPQSYRPPQVAD